MATIKSYTDLEQSKMLSEILPLETADMYYIIMGDGEEPQSMVGLGEYIGVFPTIPCWSLVALLSVLPNNEHIITSISKGCWQIDPIKYLPNTWWCEYEDNERLTEFNISAGNPIDACYKLILKLYELKLI